MHVNTVGNQSVTPEWIHNSAAFLSGRSRVCFCIRINQSMLTFKLESRCRLRDEQICHYDDKQITSQLCLHSSLMSMKKWKGPFAFYRKIPRRTQTTAGCDAWKCVIMPQIKVNPSKATCCFHSCSLSLLARRHARPAVIGCLSSMYPSNRSSSPSLALCLRAEIKGLTDGVGAKLLPQLWRSFLVSNSDLCTFSHHLLHFRFGP